MVFGELCVENRNTKTLKMAKHLEITELGNSVLRRRADIVKNIREKEIQELIDDMILTVDKEHGAGLAAPQVDSPLRIFVMAEYPSTRYPDAEEMESRVVVNPKIISASKTIEKGWEGCLSIPGIRGLVPRHNSIRVNYTDRENNSVEATLSDFAARVFQHEYDHLNGIVFLDRMDNLQEIITEKEYVKLVKKAYSETQNQD